MPDIVKHVVTDTLSHLHRPSKSKIFKEVYELRGGFVELDVADIVPGEPIQVRWRIVLDALGSLAPKTVDVSFTLEGFVIHQRLKFASAGATVGGIASIMRDQGFQNESIIIADQSVARSIYRIPDDRATRRLELKVEVSGTDGEEPTFTGAVRFRLVREATDASWWEWRVPTFESVAWKTGYSLVGDFVNRLRFARVELVTAELSEVRSEDDPSINPCDYHPIQIQTRNSVAVGARGSFQFSLLHDWKWIMSASYVILGPINKTFAYGVYFHFTDEFGNIYRGQCSSRRSRHVGVSKGKRLAGVAAQTAAANAAFWAATIFGWPIAAGWYGVAAGMGAIAKDPPAPDLAFNEEVEPEELKLAPWPDNSKEPFLEMLKLLELAAELIQLENGRTRVRAKLMGARIAGDHVAVRRQTSTYHAFESRMAEIASDLEKILPLVRIEIEADKKLIPDLLRPSLDAMFDHGLSSAAKAELVRHEFADEYVRGLEVVSNDRDSIDLARNNGKSLTPFVVSLVRFVDEIRGEQALVLAGEHYVHVEDDSAGSDEALEPELELNNQDRALRRDYHCRCY